MSNCTVCARPIDGQPLTDAQAGVAYHPACAIERLPQDALFALLGLLELVALPLIVRWAA